MHNLNFSSLRSLILGTVFLFLSTVLSAQFSFQSVPGVNGGNVRSVYAVDENTVFAGTFGGGLFLGTDPSLQAGSGPVVVEELPSMPIGYQLLFGLLVLGFARLALVRVLR